jgi:hypothetical protein
MLITDQESTQPTKTFGHVIKPEVTFQSASDRFHQSGRQRINYGAHQPRFGSFVDKAPDAAQPGGKGPYQSNKQDFFRNLIGAAVVHPISYGNPYLA